MNWVGFLLGLAIGGLIVLMTRGVVAFIIGYEEARNLAKQNRDQIDKDTAP